MDPNHVSDGVGIALVALFSLLPLCIGAFALCAFAFWIWMLIERPQERTPECDNDKPASGY